jgi:hypothetical protein
MNTKRNDEQRKKSDRPAGATATFPYDRMMIERFRESFPRARWNDDLKAWFVPGKTAEQRVGRWLERDAAALDAYANSKGLDAYVFDPIASDYLLVHDDHLEVRTPYSRTVVEALREVPFASWDPDHKLWRIPYQSYEALRRRWDRIEVAARRHEPEEQKRRQEQRRGSEQERTSRARASERRRRRHPLSCDLLPPLGRPVMTATYGVVVFTEVDGELVEPEVLSSFYADIAPGDDYVWGRWRPATLDELIKTWPMQSGSARKAGLSWWRPTIDELRCARKAARSLERRRHPVRAPLPH